MAGDDPTTLVNPFAPPAGAALAEPVQLKFEVPPQAPDRTEHPDLQRLLQVAKHGADERERISAFESLISIFQQQVSELRGGQRRQIDPPLLRFISEQSLRVIANSDPSKGARFLAAAKPGKRASAAVAVRDLQIASEVVRLIESDMAPDDAIDAAAKGYGLSWERVEKIYKRHQWEAARRGTNASKPSSPAVILFPRI